MTACSVKISTSNYSKLKAAVNITLGYISDAYKPRSITFKIPDPDRRTIEQLTKNNFEQLYFKITEQAQLLIEQLHTEKLTPAELRDCYIKSIGMNNNGFELTRLSQSFIKDPNCELLIKQAKQISISPEIVLGVANAIITELLTPDNAPELFVTQHQQHPLYRS